MFHDQQLLDDFEAQSLEDKAEIAAFMDELLSKHKASKTKQIEPNSQPQDLVLPDLNNPGCHKR